MRQHLVSLFDLSHHLNRRLFCKSYCGKMSSFWVEKPRELSPNHITWILLLSISVPVCLAIYSYLNVLILRRQLPPGPFPLPVFGNHYEIIRWRPWTQFEKWSQQYNSPMITIWLGSRPVILINDASTASELLENRADVYSSRPRMVSMAELHNAEITNQAAMPYGEHWRLHRRLTVSSIPAALRDTLYLAGKQRDVLLILPIRSTPSSGAMLSVTTALSKATSRKSSPWTS